MSDKTVTLRDVEEALKPLLSGPKLKLATAAVCEVIRLDPVEEFPAKPGDLIWVKYYGKRTPMVLFQENGRTFKALTLVYYPSRPVLSHAGNLRRTSFLGMREELHPVDSEVARMARMQRFPTLRERHASEVARLKSKEEA